MNAPTSLHQRRLLIGILAVACLLNPSITMATERENCASFSTHQEAVRWFEEHGGSASNNPGGLDADRDGIPCEHLFETEREVENTGSTARWYLIGGAILCVALGACVFAYGRRGRSPKADKQPPQVADSFRPIVPAAHPVADTGILVISVKSAQGESHPGQLMITLDGTTSVHDWPDGPTPFESTHEVEAGEIMVTIGAKSTPDLVTDLLLVAAGDVARMDIVLPASGSRTPD